MKQEEAPTEIDVDPPDPEDPLLCLYLNRCDQIHDASKYLERNVGWECRAVAGLLDWACSSGSSLTEEIGWPDTGKMALVLVDVCRWPQFVADDDSLVGLLVRNLHRIRERNAPGWPWLSRADMALEIVGWVSEARFFEQATPTVEAS